MQLYEFNVTNKKIKSICHSATFVDGFYVYTDTQGKQVGVNSTNLNVLKGSNYQMYSLKNSLEDYTNQLLGALLGLVSQSTPDTTRETVEPITLYKYTTIKGKVTREDLQVKEATQGYQSVTNTTLCIPYHLLDKVLDPYTNLVYSLTKDLGQYGCTKYASLLEGRA